MGISAFETEISIMANKELFEYECWLDYVERESWIDKMIVEEKDLAIRDEARRLLKIDSITEDELRLHLDSIDVTREKL